MSTLIIGNSYNDYLIGDLGRFDPVERRVCGNFALRLAWLLEPGDVIVLPQPADPSFVAYLTAFKGIPADSVTILVPPSGEFGTDILTRQRLTHPEFEKLLAETVAAADIDLVLPYVFDPTIAALCRRFGLQDQVRAFPFLAQGGAEMLNSKSAFRALAAGVGAPLADGVATRSRREATAFVRDMLAAGGSVIVKQDLNIGGHGNEILTGDPELTQIGAISRTVITDPGQVADLIAERWPAYSNDGTNKVVLEQYLPDSVPIGAEVDISPSEITVRHIGEMRMTPIFDGVVLPGLTMTRERTEEFRSAVFALCGAVRAIGYRGLMNIDGIVDTSGRILLTEYNGRLGGTTHLHWLGLSAVGPHYADGSVLVSKNDWKVESVDAARQRLEAAGLAYDRARGSGVVITCDHTAQSGVVEYCVLGLDHTAAEETEAALKELF
ncbi:preATP grasp domain-containing protein [Streptomyces sp. 6N223]|uniref:preATP grasp domain-containing protein n=1 Tax=Streptomyces sp. 6N223 TaxID=3457412 RepID=UPI003FD13677